MEHQLEATRIRMNKDEFDIRGGANKKLTYTGKRQLRGFQTSVTCQASANQPRSWPPNWLRPGLF